MDKELKPCPGCGGSNIEFQEITSNTSEGYYHCMEPNCGWDGPLGLIVDGEVETLWNKRADTKASAIPTSLIWLLENVREQERTRIYEKMKENLYNLCYIINDE